jgi:hypothetical protein
MQFVQFFVLLFHKFTLVDSQTMTLRSSYAYVFEGCDVNELNVSCIIYIHYVPFRFGVLKHYMNVCSQYHYRMTDVSVYVSSINETCF